MQISLNMLMQSTVLSARHMKVHMSLPSKSTIQLLHGEQSDTHNLSVSALYLELNPTEKPMGHYCAN
jgi:hypothetical protein